MNVNLFTEYISNEVNSKTVLLFGGNIERRHEIILLLQPLSNVSVYVALSEEEGIEKLQTLSKIDVILIGGRYTEEQRVRIRNFVHSNYPDVKITEPGYHYPYNNEAIFNSIKNLVNYEII